MSELPWWTNWVALAALVSLAVWAAVAPPVFIITMSKPWCADTRVDDSGWLEAGIGPPALKTQKGAPCLPDGVMVV